MAFVGDSKVLLSSAELDAAGRSDLRRAMKLYGGAVEWAHDLGVELRPGQDRRPYTADDARREIEEVMARVGRLPSSGYIRGLGYRRLAAFVERMGGSGRVLAALGRQGRVSDSGA